MKTIIRLPLLIFHFFLEARRSPYKRIWEKCEVFRILLRLHVKSEFVKPKSGHIRFRMFGYHVTAGEYLSLATLFREIFLNREYLFETSNASPRIIDCGANIGMSLLFFKQTYPQCSIIAFEPNPHAFELLEQNVRDNDLTGVVLVNSGLSDVEGFADLYINDSMGSMITSMIKERGGNNQIRASFKKLSTYLSQDRYDLIKMDVEGAEWNILKDLVSAGLLSQAGQYIIEYHHMISQEKKNLSEFLRLFEIGGFTYNIKGNFNKGHLSQDIMLYCRQENSTS